MRYVYSVVRFVPDPVRGEFVNVGAIVGSDDAGEWTVEQVDNLQRARRLDDRGVLPTVASFMDVVGRDVDEFQDAVEEGLEPDRVVSEAWLADLSHVQRHSVQLSRPMPILAESLEDAVSTVLSELVPDPVRERLPYVRRTKASAALRQAFRARFPTKEQVFERVRVQTGPHVSLLDFAIANGSVVQLAQAWSFQVPDQDDLVNRIRSWGWAMERLRDSGASVVAAGRRLAVDSGVDVEVVYAPPADGQVDARAFEDGMGVFKRIGASATPMEGAGEVADRALELMSA